MLPNFRLAAIFAKLAQEHSGKILHANSIDLLTRDLGDALRRQKKYIQDPDLNIVETAYEVLPVIAEVKIFTAIVSNKMGIDTTGKATIDVMEEIIQKTEERQSKSARAIKETIEWTREFFSQPEIQEILQTNMTAIEKPENWTNVGSVAKSFFQVAQRLSQQFVQLQEFLKRAKAQPAEKQDIDPPAQKPDEPKV